MYVHAYIHKYNIMYIRMYVHTYIDTYIDTYMHAHTHIYTCDINTYLKRDSIARHREKREQKKAGLLDGPLSYLIQHY